MGSYAHFELLNNVEVMIRWKGGTFNVNDEGDYYYPKDIKKLEEAIGYVDALISKVVSSLSRSKL